MDQLAELLKTADFSAETDLKERLRRKLFGEGSGRTPLSDDEAERVAAAGNSQPDRRPNPALFESR